MGKLKDWYIRSWKETLNNPMNGLRSTLVVASIFISGAGFFSGYFFYIGDYLMVAMSIGIWLVPAIMLNDSVYKPMKKYYEKYGETGIGDEFEKEAIKSGKPIRTVMRY